VVLRFSNALVGRWQGRAGLPVSFATARFWCGSGNIPAISRQNACPLSSTTSFGLAAHTGRETVLIPRPDRWRHSSIEQ